MEAAGRATKVELWCILFLTIQKKNNTLLTFTKLNLHKPVLKMELFR